MGYVEYTDGFRSRMVRRLLGPEGISACALSKEIGVPQSTLSRWARRARTLEGMSDKKIGGKRVRRDRSASEKVRIVMEAMKLSEDELGAFLRREGLHSTELEEWSKAVMTAGEEALSPSRKKKRGASAEAAAAKKKLLELERELRRKDKALAEVTALLALKKKLEAILGDEDDGTPSRRET